MAKKEKRETLLLKYGIVAFLEITCAITVFLIITTAMTKKPVQNIYDESIENFMQQAADNAETWFENQVEMMNVFQRAVVNNVDTTENIYARIKEKTKPNGFDYVMIFVDSDTTAKDGGPSTYNTKGGTSNAGITSKEYYTNHKNKNVDVWLESPRMANTGVYSMPLFVNSEFKDANTGKTVTGGMVGFLELEPINNLAKTFYKTGTISVYDDTGAIRAGDDVLAETNPNALVYEKSFKLANKEWKVVASVQKSEVSAITNDLRRNSFVGGFLIALILVICELIIIKIMIGKFNSIKRNIDNLNTGDKDLTKRLKINHNNEISFVKKSVNTFVNTVHETVKQIGEANTDLRNTFNNVKTQLDASKAQIDKVSNEIIIATETLQDEDQCVIDTSQSVTQISDNIKSLNGMIQDQVAAITQASASIEEMIGNIQSVTNSVEKMAAEFSELNDATADGIEKNRIVNELLAGILEQSQSLQDTNRIIATISSQTNLLSMNAMIESAHAGDAGKGFAVVAEEIRKLADTSAAQSKNIGENLKKIAENIAKVVESANASKLSFELVSDKTNNTSQLVEQIKCATEEQTEGSKQLLDALASMNNISNSVQASSKKIEARAENILDNIASLRQSSEMMSNNFSRIVETNEESKQTTESIQRYAGEMSSAVDNISSKIDEFKV